MGTINYKTSDYITLGIKPYDREDIIRDPSFADELKEVYQELTQEVIESTADNCINNYYEDDYTEAEYILNKYSLYYYHVKIEFGYYEGLSIDIENNFSIAIDSWEDRKEQQKEITQLKKLLIDLANIGFVACCPGWCTRYEDYAGTMLQINEAIKEMRNEAKNTPTWRQYERG